MLFRPKYTKSSDEELMQYIVKGHERAFDVLYARYAGKMHYYFYRLLSQNKEKSDDFVQELFLKIIEKPESFDPKRKFSSWLYSIASNMCKNEYRRTERHPQQVPETEIAQLPAPGDLVQPIDNKLFRQSLQNALDELKPNHRQAFVLRYQEELSVKEISEIMDCPEGTVKSRLFYALKALANKLEIFRGSYHSNIKS